MPPFLGISGVSPFISTEGNLSAESAIDIFFPCDLFETLAVWTNKRVNILVDTYGYPQYLNDWNSVTPNEIRKFFGICLFIGIVKKPSISDYWSTDELYSSPFFARSECLPRDRFLSIFRMVRFCDYANLDNNDKFAKARPFCTIVRRLCMESYLPEQNISVDEKLMKYRGRVFNRMYIPSKRARLKPTLYVNPNPDTFGTLSHTRRKVITKTLGRTFWVLTFFRFQKELLLN